MELRMNPKPGFFCPLKTFVTFLARVSVTRMSTAVLEILRRWMV